MIITHFEKDKNRAFFCSNALRGNAVCDLVEVLPFGNQEAHFSALIRAQLEIKGTPIGPYDLLIAGTTLAHQGILVTNNKKEFTRVSELKIENWYE